MIGLPKFVQVLPAPTSLSMARAAAANCAPLLDRSEQRLPDGAPQSLCQHQGKAILVVNSARLRALTAQHEGIRFVYDKCQAHRDGVREGRYRRLPARGNRTLVTHIERCLAEKR